MRNLLTCIILMGLSVPLFSQTVQYDTIITITILDRMVYDTTIIERVAGRAPNNISSSGISSTDFEINTNAEMPVPPDAITEALKDLENNIDEKTTNTDDAPDLDAPTRLALTIQAQQMKTRVAVLASDAFEGRETGKPGQKKAANYLANEFKKMGIAPLTQTPNFQQSIPLVYEQWGDISIRINDSTFTYLKDFYSFPKSNRNRAAIEGDEVVFLGYGIDDPLYSDYEGVDVQDKIILIYQGEPINKDSISYLTGTKEFSEWGLDWEKKLRLARSKGVKAVLFIERNIPFFVTRYNYYLTKPYLRLADKDPAREFANSAYISTDLARAIIGNRFEKLIRMRNKIRDSGKPQALSLPCKITIQQQENQNNFTGENVVAYIEGVDPDLKHEHVVISAHYDHLGKVGLEVFNGADDNASGTSAVLEIAEAFALGKKEGIAPRRSVLVMAVSGEEKGLLGSEHYVDNPLFSLDHAVANVNIDMIGRVDKKHKDDPDYIYVIGADRLSTELHEINEKVNRKYLQIELDYTYNEEDDPNRYYYRSDHYNFAEKGIPAIFYFSGTHKDYHRPTDTADKLDYNKMERIARLAFYTAFELANRDKRIQVDVDPK